MGELYKQRKASYNKTYREKYPEKKKTNRQAEYWINPEKFREDARQYREEHREEVNRKQREAYHRRKEQNIHPSENGENETQETICEMMKNNI